MRLMLLPLPLSPCISVAPSTSALHHPTTPVRTRSAPEPVSSHVFQVRAVSRVPCSFYCKATPHIVQGRVIHFLPDSAQLFINCCSLGEDGGELSSPFSFVAHPSLDGASPVLRWHCFSVRGIKRRELANERYTAGWDRDRENERTRKRERKRESEKARQRGRGVLHESETRAPSTNHFGRSNQRYNLPVCLALFILLPC